MDICTDLNTISHFDKSVLTIGAFDGMHYGHMEIIKELKLRSEHKRIPSIVITFDPHPKSILKSKGDDTWELLMCTDKKLEIFENHEIDYIWLIPFNEEFSQVTADYFLDNYIIKYFNPMDIVIGYDHHFGHKRYGDLEYLNKNKEQYNYNLYVQESIKLNDVPVSSSQIRSYLKEPNLEAANRFLGREYEFSGNIVEGDGRGQLMNIPTANIVPNNLDQLIPAKGVYCVDANVDNHNYSGMCNIGVRPTFYADGDSVIEVHLITDDKLSLYGKEIQIKFKEFIREEKKYRNAEDLANQLMKDRYHCQIN